MRVCKYVERLRTGTLYRALRRELERYLGLEDFRVVHISIQGNHIHLLIEARDREAFSSRMRSLAINFARAINAASNGRGKVFEYRYHARQITTPRQARNSLAYVLNNWRRHKEDFASKATIGFPVDPYSSGVTFDGWSPKPRYTLPDGYVPLPVSPPRTALLRNSYQEYGRIDPFELPGPIW